jgi:hypothetical protein
VARALGAQDAVAWDAYVFYAPGELWTDSPPSPFAWAHQLGPESWADPRRYFTRQALVDELARITDELVRHG